MGICDSRDIFKANKDDILGYIKCVKVNIYGILVLRKYEFPKNIDHVIVISDRLCSFALKVNTPKYNFGLNHIPCLGYIIT